MKEQGNMSTVDVRVPERGREKLLANNPYSFLCLPHNCSSGLASSIDPAKATRFRNRGKLFSGTIMATSAKLQDIFTWAGNVIYLIL